MGLKTRGVFGATGDTLRHREVCVEAKRSRKGGVSIRGAGAMASYKGILIICQVPIYIYIYMPGLISTLDME